MIIHIETVTLKVFSARFVSLPTGPLGTRVSMGLSQAYPKNQWMIFKSMDDIGVNGLSPIQRLEIQCIIRIESSNSVPVYKLTQNPTFFLCGMGVLQIPSLKSLLCSIRPSHNSRQYLRDRRLAGLTPQSEPTRDYGWRASVGPNLLALSRPLNGNHTLGLVLFVGSGLLAVYQEGLADCWALALSMMARIYLGEFVTPLSHIEKMWNSI